MKWRTVGIIAAVATFLLLVWLAIEMVARTGPMDLP